MMYSVKLKPLALYNRQYIVAGMVVVFFVLIMFYTSGYFMSNTTNIKVVNMKRDDVARVVRRNNSKGYENFYGIIFDAGSTGSRIHIFKLRRKPNLAAELVHETFKAIKPGLSSYANDPKLGVLTLKPLLDLAANTIPKKYHKSTLIALKATAGLRLLPEDTADEILMEVRKLFSKYDFMFHKDDDDIAIMQGADEGIYMWVTVNFLLGALTGKTDKVTTFDLGGGSTQITFVPKLQSTIKLLPKTKIKQIRLFSETYRLYSHSYLGMGLMSARLEGMGHKTTPKVASSPLVNVLSSPCLPANYIGNWSVQSTDLIVRGLPKDEAGYEKCYEMVRKLTLSHNIIVIPELRDEPVYIFSYYFDRAIDADIIRSVDGARVTPAHYRDAAVTVCGDHRYTKKPFLCFDLTYIYSLLTDGFGLPHTFTLNIYKKINNVEMSWALGSMFGLMSQNNTA